MLISTYQLDEINKEITAVYIILWTRLPSQCFHITNHAAPVPYTQTDLSPFANSEWDGLIINKVCLWNVSLLFPLLWKMWDINFVYTEHSHKIPTQPWAMVDHIFFIFVYYKGRELLPLFLLYLGFILISTWQIFCVVFQDFQIQCRLHNQALTTELECWQAGLTNFNCIIDNLTRPLNFKYIFKYISIII